jgi:hypothetical protein
MLHQIHLSIGSLSKQLENCPVADVYLFHPFSLTLLTIFKTISHIEENTQGYPIVEFGENDTFFTTLLTFGSWFLSYGATTSLSINLLIFLALAFKPNVLLVVLVLNFSHIQFFSAAIISHFPI